MLSLITGTSEPIVASKKFKLGICGSALLMLIYPMFFLVPVIIGALYHRNLCSVILVICCVTLGDSIALNTLCFSSVIVVLLACAMREHKT
jgi:hypothetical protein